MALALGLTALVVWVAVTPVGRRHKEGPVVYDDALEWMWWAGAGHAGPITRDCVGGPFVWRGHAGVIREVASNAVLVEWNGSPPVAGPAEVPGKGKSK